LSKIERLQERLRQLEEQLEKEKEEAHKNLGEELVKQLDIDYELLSTKKDVKSVVEMIANELESNPFSDESQPLEPTSTVEEKDNVPTQY